MMAPRRGHVSVVEDSDEDFEMVLADSRLATVINEIRRATSGDECLQHLANLESKNLPLPILVLLDLNAPREDGRDALRGIIRNERLRAMPLVVISASSNWRDVSFCYDHRANAYHLKTFSHPQPMQILENIFSYWLTSAILPDFEGIDPS